MWYVFLIFLIFIDLFTKYLAQIYLQDTLYLFWDLVFLKLVLNKWIAFSIQITWIILKILTIIIISIILWYYFKQEKPKKNSIYDISFVFIIRWAIWNGIERIFLWVVTDFFWIKYFSIFNMADVFITIWWIIFIIAIILEWKQIKNKH